MKSIHSFCNGPCLVYVSTDLSFLACSRAITGHDESNLRAKTYCNFVSKRIEEYCARRMSLYQAVLLTNTDFLSTRSSEFSHESVVLCCIKFYHDKADACMIGNCDILLTRERSPRRIIEGSRFNDLFSVISDSWMSDIAVNAIGQDEIRNMIFSEVIEIQESDRIFLSSHRLEDISDISLRSGSPRSIVEKISARRHEELSLVVIDV